MAEVAKLTSRQLAELSLSALGNAQSLFDDARRLETAGRHASAFLLAGLAADELGKHILVTSFPARRPDEAEWVADIEFLLNLVQQLLRIFGRDSFTRPQNLTVVRNVDVRRFKAVLVECSRVRWRGVIQQVGQQASSA